MRTQLLQDTKIFVTGATGYIGGSIAQRLAAAGAKVRGLGRSEARAAALARLGVEPVLGSLSDLDLLTREARAADAVIDAADSDNRQAAETLVRALSGTGKALIHTSGSSIVSDEAGGEPSDTIHRDLPEKPVPGKVARVDIDTLVLASAADNVRGIVICPTMIYGEGRGPATQSQQIPAMLAHAKEAGISHYVGRGLNRWSHVHIDDVVTLYVLALEKAAPGSFFYAENGEASLIEIARDIARHLQVSGPESLSLEAAAAVWGEHATVYGFGSNSRVWADRARTELGWAPRHSSIFHDLPREAALYRQARG